MPESLISKRCIFPSGKQRRFLLSARKKLKLSWPQFVDKIGVHKRTFNDWKREKYSLPLGILKKICIITKLKIPKDIEIRDPFWYIYRGGRAGGLAVYKKYGRIGGDPEYRKKKWYEWWEREGRFNPHKYFVAKEITIPQRNNKLAEFVGIIIGDGGITKRQITVTLNCETDKLYSSFVKNLIRELFEVDPSIYVRKNESTVSIVVSRTHLVSFCKSIGLKIGNKLKQNLDIPEWIKRNKSFTISCIRGLIDTDGCLFNECHKINKKKYCYPRLSFESYSKQLRSSVFRILKELGFSSKIRNNRSVHLENRNDIIEYFNLIGTSNPKHERKFEFSLGGVGSGYPKRF